MHQHITRIHRIHRTHPIEGDEPQRELRVNTYEQMNQIMKLSITHYLNQMLT